MKKIFCITASLLILSSGAALADHGKAGLWTTTSTVNMAAMVSPEVLAKMKAAGVDMPTAKTFTTQTCMTQAQVEADRPPTADRTNGDCESHVTNVNSSSMTAETVCKGRTQSTSKIEITYSSPEHYSGTNTMQGMVDGRPINNISTFTGDWVSADCGSVKPGAAPAAAK